MRPGAAADRFSGGQEGSSVGRCSFLPGVREADLRDVLPPFVVEALKRGFAEFERKMPGFVTGEATLIGVETRTSSPVRIIRGEDGQSVTVAGLFPCGEGAGYAGGIVSSALDGIRAAERLVNSLGLNRASRMRSSPLRVIRSKESRRASSIRRMPRSPTALIPVPTIFGARMTIRRSARFSFRNDVIDAGTALNEEGGDLPLTQERSEARADRRAPPFILTDFQDLDPLLFKEPPPSLPAPCASRPRSSGDRRTSKTVASGEVRRRESTTIRRGFLPRTRRQVSSGSSFRTVPAPTRIASWARRSRWAKRSDAGELIQREWPVAVAIRPSRVWANFRVTKGMPVRMYLKKTSFCRRHASSRTPDLRFDPVTFQGRDAPAGDEGIGIDRADDDAAGTAGDQGVDAGGGLAVMAARFQGDVEGRTRDRFRRVRDGVDLGMIFPAAAVVAFGDDPAVPDDHGADQRIRADAPFALPGQPKRPAHEAFIGQDGFSLCHALFITRSARM